MKAHIKLVALIAAIVLALGLVSRPMNAAASRDGGAISDDAGVLSETTKEFITERNRNLEANCRGAQIAVVTMDTVGSGPIEDYAQRYFERNDIGRSEENNGVLLLVAVEDKDYYIVTGSGLSSVFTTETLSNIIRNDIEPAFRDGEYEAAIKSGFSGLNEAVCRHYDVDPDAEVNEDGFDCGSYSCSEISCGSCGGLMFFGCVACVVFGL